MLGATCPGLCGTAVAILLLNTGSSHPSQLSPVANCSPMAGNPRKRGRRGSPGFPPRTSYSGRIRPEIHKVQAVGFYEAHLEGKSLAPLSAMKMSKSFKPGPLSASKPQSHLTPLPHPPSSGPVPEGFSCTPSSVLISRWSSQTALVTVSLLPPLSLYSRLPLSRTELILLHPSRQSGSRSRSPTSIAPSCCFNTPQLSSGSTSP